MPAQYARISQFQKILVKIWRRSLLDSISGSAWVPWNVPAQHARWSSQIHIGPNLAPLIFGFHFWICLCCVERARAALQMANSNTHWSSCGTAPFWIPFLDLLGYLGTCSLSIPDSQFQYALTQNMAPLPLGFHVWICLRSIQYP